MSRMLLFTHCVPLFWLELVAEPSSLILAIPFATLVQVYADDVAAQLPRALLLPGAQQLLHAILYLSDAYYIHYSRLCG